MKKNTMFVTQDELVKSGATTDQIESMLKEPQIGYHINRHRKLEQTYELAGKVFDGISEEIGDIAPQSCFRGTLKKGDLLFSINGATISYHHKQKVYIKNDQAFIAISEFCKDNEEVEIQYLSEQNSTRSTDPFRSGREVEYTQKKATITLKFLYELTDEKIVEQIERTRIRTLPAKIKAKIFNQDHAIDQVYKSLKVYFAGLKEDSKPIGSYLLVGPTGTGKTELAKLIASTLDFTLVRIDMSEYGERHTVSRLIGSPPSYVGYGDKTILEKEIGNDGKKVVLLLDEMEKAHWDLQKIFLQAMDNSRITLANGVEVNFKNTLVLMTSNLGTVTKGSIGLGGDGQKILSVNMDEVRSHFLPEFMGRLSGTVQFNPLQTAQAKLILEKFISEFNQNQLGSKNCSIKVSDSAKDQLVSKGFNQLYGARPLKHTLQNEIFEKIADLFLFATEKSSTIKVDWDGTEFTTNFEVDNQPTVKKGFVNFG